MPRAIHDGEIKIQFVTTLSSVTAPTVAQINAGVDVTEYMRSFDTPLDGNAVNSSDLSSAFNKTVAGKYGGNITCEMYRDDDGVDAAWVAFPRNTTGYFVVRRFGGSGVAFAAVDDVEVYYVRVITRSPNTADEESMQMFTVDCAVLDEPELEAVVAA